jgi:hypothetical protein
MIQNATGDEKGDTRTALALEGRHITSIAPVCYKNETALLCAMLCELPFCVHASPGIYIPHTESVLFDSPAAVVV